MTQEDLTVGVVVERRILDNPWIDHVWLPSAILPGAPAAPEWTALRADGGVSQFYAGAHVISFFSIDTANYRSNLANGSPKIWVSLRRTDGEPPVRVVGVTADPAEGEAFTEAGDDIVEAITMPPEVAARLAASSKPIMWSGASRNAGVTKPIPRCFPPGREVYAAQEMTAMNDDGESFLGRWSKRKSQAQTGAKSEEPRSEAEGSRQSGAQDAEPEEIALEDLPPIESIDASTDLSQWLRKRVPDTWRQAALKRVWATDPAISQFIGLAENSWDRNAPDGVPGFGPLSPTHDVTRLLAQVIGQLPENDAPEAGNAETTTSDLRHSKRAVRAD